MPQKQTPHNTYSMVVTPGDPQAKQLPLPYRQAASARVADFVLSVIGLPQAVRS